jgi:hypothetical protein
MPKLVMVRMDQLQPCLLQFDGLRFEQQMPRRKFVIIERFGASGDRMRW